MERLMTLVCIVIRYSGLAYLFRILTRKRIQIVLYHDPSPEVFEEHLKYLSSHYRLISLNDVLELTAPGSRRKIPRGALWITFDDGWKGNRRLLPSMIRYGCRPTIFLATQVVATNRHFWWTVCSPAEVSRLKYLPHAVRLRELKEKYDYTPGREYAERQTLSLEEISQMKAYVDFGLHTCSHPVLTTCTIAEKRKEIAVCAKEAERLGCYPVFAYPNGDYDRECIRILKESGISLARTTDAGWNKRNSDRYTLKVSGASDTGSLTRLIAEMTGIPRFLQHLFLFRSFNGKKGTR